MKWNAHTHSLTHSILPTVPIKSSANFSLRYHTSTPNGKSWYQFNAISTLIPQYARQTEKKEQKKTNENNNNTDERMALRRILINLSFVQSVRVYFGPSLALYVCFDMLNCHYEHIVKCMSFDVCRFHFNYAIIYCDNKPTAAPSYIECVCFIRLYLFCSCLVGWSVQHNISSDEQAIKTRMHWTTSEI